MMEAGGGHGWGGGRARKGPVRGERGRRRAKEESRGCEKPSSSGGKLQQLLMSRASDSPAMRMRGPNHAYLCGTDAASTPPPGSWTLHGPQPRALYPVSCTLPTGSSGCFSLHSTPHSTPTI